MSEIQKSQPVECDCCGGTWGYINDEGEHDNVYDCVHELTRQRDTLRRILAALREPSEAVLKAVVLHYSGDKKDAIRAAVAAAEQEVEA